jgi:hypothetical protein
VSGQTISHYCIIDKLGGGKRGIIYKAEDTEIGHSSPLSFFLMT